MQNEQRAIPEFATWYPTWQERMKAHEPMRWLVEARNEVVKHGDLVTKSTARVGLIASWLDFRVLGETEVPAVLDARDVAAHFSAERKKAGQTAELEQAKREDAAIVVERRWVVDTMPERELLDLLAQ